MLNVNCLQEKDEYGNEITQLARPLPVEYLLVDMGAAFPVEPIFTFPAPSSIKPFPVENRTSNGENQVCCLSIYMILSTPLLSIIEFFLNKVKVFVINMFYNSGNY